jgi:hypothetical protein
MMRNNTYVDESGNRYGRLTVIGPITPKTKPPSFLCKCDCGNTTKVFGSNLRRGNTRSCGCLNIEKCRLSNTTHSHTVNYVKSKTYYTWSAMLKRAGTGVWANVTVCSRWYNFVNFLEDMGEAPPGLSLDRIDCTGNYEPNNCRWATMVEQQNNRSNNRLVMYNGESRTLAQWAKDLKLNYARTYARLQLGWTAEEAFKLNTVLPGYCRTSSTNISHDKESL